MRNSKRGADRSAPSLGLFFVEGPRALFEGLTLPLAQPLLRSAPRGDGHPVLVLPGFMADDASTTVGLLPLHDRDPWMLGHLERRLSVAPPGTYARRVTPGLLLQQGFTFRHPDWPDAAKALCSEWRETRAAH